MRIMVTGSRNWANYDKIYTALQRYSGVMPPNTVVHGCARGADSLAERAAINLKMLVERHPALWGKYGKSAGLFRNIEMLESGIDQVLAFQINGSIGTQHAITQAKIRGIPTIIYSVEI